MFTFPPDDGIVVVSESVVEKLGVEDYFRLPETLRPMELVYGVVREPAMPTYGHQALAARLTARLYAPVEKLGIGQICCPVDVVLDRDAALVVQPDIVFISNERLGIATDRVWGAPDLVIEILCPSTARRDRTVKVGWYRQYGVRECWLIDPRNRTVEVIEPQSTTPSRLFSGAVAMRSYVLLQWTASVAEIFS